DGRCGPTPQMVWLKVTRRKGICELRLHCECSLSLSTSRPLLQIIWPNARRHTEQRRRPSSNSWSSTSVSTHIAHAFIAVARLKPFSHLINLEAEWRAMRITNRADGPDWRGVGEVAGGRTAEKVGLIARLYFSPGASFTETGRPTCKAISSSTAT